MCKNLTECPLPIIQDVSFSTKFQLWRAKKYQVYTDMMGLASHNARHGTLSQDCQLVRVKDKEHMSKFHDGQAVKVADTRHGSTFRVYLKKSWRADQWSRKKSCTIQQYISPLLLHDCKEFMSITYFVNMTSMHSFLHPNL